MNSNSHTIPVIIDTDIGDDVDDLLAIAYALTQEKIEILGLTTVFKNTRARARMARYFLQLADLPGLPVHAGIGEPIVNKVTTTDIPCQYSEMMDDVEIDSSDAIPFLIRTLANRKVTIVCIGPLTNIATLIEKRPDLSGNIDRLVMMGGSYYRHATEWNILCDPEAAHIVFNAGIKIQALGLDVTTLCGLSQAQFDSIKPTGRVGTFLLDMCREWLGHSGFLPVLHDPLTIHSLIDSDDLNYRPERVHIELTGKYTRGMTYCEDHGLWGREAQNPNVNVACDVNGPGFVDHFLGCVFSE